MDDQIETKSENITIQPKTTTSRKKQLVYGLVFLVIAAFAVWGVLRYIKKGRGLSSVKPTATIKSPAGYAADTQIKLYDQLPGEFPKDLWITPSSTPEHADVVQQADGKTQVTVIYNTDIPLTVVIEQEKQNLIKEGWTLGPSSVSPKASTVSASKGPDQLMLTLTPSGAAADAPSQAAFLLTLGK